MSGRKSYRELRERVRSDPERRKRIEGISEAYDVLLGLAALREGRGFTQARLASEMGVSQPNVSKIEGKEDLQLSTICNYVAALGGHLEMKAVFPDSTVDFATASLPIHAGGSTDLAHVSEGASPSKSSRKASAEAGGQ